MKQLSTKEIKETRERILKRNNYICPLLEQEIDPKDAALDHAHQDSQISETVEGQVRGVIHKFANSLEGTMRSKYIRSGCAKFVSFEVFLFNLYTYLMESREPLLHPTHAPRPKKLMKSSYNDLKREVMICNKYLTKKIKMPEYPKSKRLTKKLKELYTRFGIFPKFYLKK